MEQQEIREGIMSPNLFVEWIDETFPYGIIACDHAGNIVRINSAALKLFEVAATPFGTAHPISSFFAATRGRPSNNQHPHLSHGS